jgi:hypothetical protein
MKTNLMPRSCDIFCNVVDNYGDIGVSWRLARQLANEFGIKVRLWVDDLHSFARLCPQADAALETQHCRGVEVRLWSDVSFTLRYLRANGAEETIQSAKLVIEAFACKLPEVYLNAMALHESVWINLEYLSAEDWVEGCHKLPSPRPPLTRYFFFPGFTKKTGGLLLERDLLARRDAFLSNGVVKGGAPCDEYAMPVSLSPNSLPVGEREIVSLRESHLSAAQQAFWQSIGMDAPPAGTLKISLFAYENTALAGLLDAWENGVKKVLCLVPQGRILPQVRAYFADAMPGNAPLPYTGEGQGERVYYVRGNLQVRVLPFVEQERYDELLWACDINFVRGEDSCVRAQWAGKPFVWQVYPQHDEVHWHKLHAFLKLYAAELEPQAAQAMRALWEVWNGGEGPVAQVWHEFSAVRAELGARARGWADELSANNLTLNLLDFFQEIGTMRAFKIDGQ